MVDEIQGLLGEAIAIDLVQVAKKRIEDQGEMLRGPKVDDVRRDVVWQLLWTLVPRERNQGFKAFGRKGQ